MKIIIYQSLLMATLLMALSCEQDQFDPNVSETVVLEAYLYANEPIGNIKLTRLAPFVGDEDQSLAINDAEISIYWNDNNYDLIASPGDSGYYHYEGNELEIIAGNTYQIKLTYFGKEISASTTVPNPPSNLAISDSVLAIEPIYDFDDLFNQTIQELEITWDNSNGEYYYVLYENTENEPEDIDQSNTSGNFPGGERPVFANFSFITSPTNADQLTINSRGLTQYGTYSVKVYKVNQEYVDLYQTSEQDSRNFTEPLNNITNGLGIFTSFNSDSLFFTITK